MSTYDPRRSDARLIVYLDVKSPYAYLAKDPTKQLIRDFNIEIDWRPLTLNIPSFLGSARVDDRGEVVESKRSPRQWNSVRYAYMDAKRYARINDIKIYGPRKIWDTRLIHIAFLYVKEHFSDQLLPFLDHVYERFWLRDLDIESLDVVHGVLAHVGVLDDGFDNYVDGVGGQTHDLLQDELHPAGIFGVPSYVVDDELFFGRENLPYVRWILGGRVGPPPDIAYQGFT
ncbi:MAG: DsbA family protein [Gammaproteobacteria bacterium]|nr:DsbA family protein [Gammaproteobacteria bacterium]